MRRLRHGDGGDQTDDELQQRARRSRNARSRSMTSSDWVTNNPALSLTTTGDQSYLYQRVARRYSGFFTAVAYARLGVIMALGALFRIGEESACRGGFAPAGGSRRSARLATEAFPVATSVVLEASRVLVDRRRSSVAMACPTALFDGRLQAIVNGRVHTCPSLPGSIAHRHGVERFCSPILGRACAGRP